MGASEEPVSVALPAVPSCDIKPVFLLAMLHQHGRKAVWGVRQAAAWRPWTAMENHSYEGSIDPLWNSTARMGASEGPVSVALPAVPSCDIKPVFLLAMLHQHGRKAVWGVRQAAAMEAVDSYGKPQLRRLHRSAMEFHSHGGRS
jgi:hypothetical protein